MENIKRIIINKNRGWRGLAEVRCEDDDRNDVLKMIFSFSQPVWDDMQLGVIVLQNNENYIIVQFDGTDRLPKGQRSVLLKYFVATVKETKVIPKENWQATTFGTPYARYINHFVKNRNNHTTSDWNCIGIRVTPTI